MPSRPTDRGSVQIALSAKPFLSSRRTARRSDHATMDERGARSPKKICNLTGAFRPLDSHHLEESTSRMATLSFHASAVTARKIRSAARKRGIPMSRFLRETAERAAEGEPVSGLGRELEKLAIDGLAFAALARVRSRAAAVPIRTKP